MRILYLTQWFEPEPAFKGVGFASGLAALGHDVEVVTGFPNYPGGKLYPGHRLAAYRRERTPDGILVHRLFLYPSHDRSAFGRALNYLSFFISSFVFGLVRGRNYDAVYVYHPPITPSLAMALVARIHRLRFVIDIQDLWPDSVGASGMASPGMVRLINRLCKFVYRRADHIVVQADGMREKLIGRGVPAAKVTRIYNWATYSAADNGRRDVPAEFAGGLNIVYGGNIGQAQALTYVVDAVEIARRSVPSLRFHVFGGGIERTRLERHVAARPEANVVIHEPVGRDRMDRIFDEADILVLHLKDDPLYEFTIPSKLQHYLACGKPIVAGVVGEAARILRASGGAMVCAPEDSAAIAQAMADLGLMSATERREMGQRAREYYETNFAMASALMLTSSLLTNAAHEPARQVTAAIQS